MRHLLLPVKRRFNTWAYLILVGLLVPAVFAIQPFYLTITGTQYASVWMLLISAGVDLLLLAALGAAGLWLASRTGLGMPFIEGWTKREPPWNRAPGVAGISLLAGISLVLIVALDAAAAPFLMRASAAQAGGSPVDAVAPPAWQGILASFSAGITEETMYRLFGLTLLAWLGGLLFRSPTGRPAPWLLWAANLLFALVFGLMHLRTAARMGIPLDTMIVIRTLILNGAGGIVFGWLYWSFGLESAMLSHISADVVLKGFVPLVTQQADPTWRMIAGALVGLALIVTIFWSVRAILRDRREFPISAGDYSLQPEAGLTGL